MTMRRDPPGAATAALRGAASVSLATALVRVASVLAQLALGRLLLTDDFGLYALAVTAWMLAQLLTSPGLDDVLIARGARMRLWAPPAVWASLALGVLATLVMVAAAPVAARAYADPGVAPLVLIIGLAALPTALSLVPGAIIRARMQFRLWAGYLAASQVLLFALQVALASAGLGARALVIPIPIVATLGLAFLWWAARPPASRAPRLKRWRWLVGDAAPLLGVRALQTVQVNADRAVLGVVAATGVAGVYYFAFQIATQVGRVLASGLSQALFPGLAGLRDRPDRQLAGALAAARLAGLVGVPAACLQAACVGPTLHLLFGDKWQAAVFPAQVMSVAAGIDAMAWVGASLMQSQRRFGLMFRVQAGSCAALLLLVVVAGLRAPEGAQAAAIAWAVAVHAAIVPAIGLGVAVRAAGGRWSDAARVYTLPVLLSIPTALAAFTAAAAVPGRGPGTDALRILAALAAGGTVYLLLAISFARPLLLDLRSRVRQALGRG